VGGRAFVLPPSPFSHNPVRRSAPLHPPLRDRRSRDLPSAGRRCAQLPFLYTAPPTVYILYTYTSCIYYIIYMYIKVILFPPLFSPLHLHYIYIGIYLFNRYMYHGLYTVYIYIYILYVLYIYTIYIGTYLLSGYARALAQLSVCVGVRFIINERPPPSPPTATARKRVSIGRWPLVGLGPSSDLHGVTRLCLYYRSAEKKVHICERYVYSNKI